MPGCQERGKIEARSASVFENPLVIASDKRGQELIHKQVGSWFHNFVCLNERYPRGAGGQSFGKIPLFFNPIRTGLFWFS